jgi:glycosyltransferase involved in cell wall biosynthesis
VRIGLDARLIQGPFTGDSTYWRGLIEGLSCLDADLVLYLDAKLPEPEISVSRGIPVRILQACCSRVWSAWTFPRALKEDGIQVAHVQYTIPPRMPCPTITTIHDVSFKRLPEFFKLKDRLILDWSTKRASKKAIRIIAPSQHTKKELVGLYGMDPGKIAVTYEGVDKQFQPMDHTSAVGLISEKYGIQPPFILALGVIQPRKNLGRLIEGFAGLKSRLRTGSRERRGGNLESEHKLVIVGKQGWMEADLQSRIEALGLANDVILTGYVPYEDLPALYSAADVFVYPSVYEGFGLPPLEAMACGTPVIAGDRSSLPEVVGEAGLMVDPYDPDAFAKAMARVLSSESLRAEMRTRGLSQASKFSWDKMARETLEIYRTAI